MIATYSEIETRVNWRPIKCCSTVNNCRMTTFNGVRYSSCEFIAIPIKCSIQVDVGYYFSTYHNINEKLKSFATKNHLNSSINQFKHSGPFLGPVYRDVRAIVVSELPYYNMFRGGVYMHASVILAGR